MDLFLPILVVFFAVFTQSLAGFGVALVAMALLPGLVGIRTAAPLVALVAVTIEVFLLYRYRRAVKVRAVLPIALASILGIPLGVWLLRSVDEKIVMTLLGVVIAGYALYALLKIKLPRLDAPIWAYLVGLVAGILGGAYNTSGPPVIIYGDCRGWPPAEFKGNLQGFFIINSAFVALGHGLSRNLTPEVWSLYLWSLPAIALGFLAGASLDRTLSPATFRQVVLAVLVVMGIRLVI